MVNVLLPVVHCTPVLTGWANRPSLRHSTVTCAGHPPSETPEPFVSPTLHILSDSVSAAGTSAGQQLAGCRRWLPLRAALWASPAFPANPTPHHSQTMVQVKMVEDALDELTGPETISGYRPQVRDCLKKK